MSSFKKWVIISCIWIVVIGFVITTLRILDDIYLGTGHRGEEDIIKEALDKQDKYKKLNERYGDKIGDKKELLEKFLNR
jgi:hypothetical protein